MVQQGVRFARVHGRIVPIRSGGSSPAKRPAAPKKEPLHLGKRIGQAAVGAMAVGLGIHFGAGMARSVIRAGGGAAIAGINKGISRIAKDPVLRNTAARAVAPNLRVAKAGLKGMIHPMNLYGGLVGTFIGGLGASLIGSAFRRRKTVKPQARSSV